MFSSCFCLLYFFVSFSFSGARLVGSVPHCMMNCIGRRENTRRFGRMGKPATVLSGAVKRFVGFEFLFCFMLYSCSLPDFLCSTLSPGFQFQVVTVISLSHSLACVSIVTNPDIISFYTLALRAAITLRHSRWGLERNRSRGWELDAAPRGHSLITSWGPIPPFFRFLLPSSTLFTGSGSWSANDPADGGFWASTRRARAGLRPSGMA